MTAHRAIHRLQTQVEELETRDPLTGLRNVRALRTWLEHHLPRANEVQSHTALLVIHAEGIDRINESHGREIGDELLMALVARARSCLLDKDQVFRAGGTDIAVVRPDLAGTHAAEELAETIMGLLANPYEVDGERLRVPVCMGLAVAGGRPTNADDMLRDAEVATYRATTTGAGVLVRFEQSLVESLTPATAEHRLRTALERGDFQVTYLPVFSLTTGEVVEVEALLRWIDEGRGMVAPDEFLIAMEQTGIIVPVGSWVVHEVCRQATYWARTFPSHRPVRVTANLSRRQLLQADFNELVATALDDADTDPTRVILEVNERSLADQREDLWSVLRRTKDLGVAVSLDDLGAANSSLATLRRFQLDQVKIDHSFIETVMASAEDTAVVRHLTCAVPGAGHRHRGQGGAGSGPGRAPLPARRRQRPGPLLQRAGQPGPDRRADLRRPHPVRPRRGQRSGRRGAGDIAPAAPGHRRPTHPGRGRPGRTGRRPRPGRHEAVPPPQPDVQLTWRRFERRSVVLSPLFAVFSPPHSRSVVGWLLPVLKRGMVGTCPAEAAPRGGSWS